MLKVPLGAAKWMRNPGKYRLKYLREAPVSSDHPTENRFRTAWVFEVLQGPVGIGTEMWFLSNDGEAFELKDQVVECEVTLVEGREGCVKHEFIKDAAPSDELSAFCQAVNNSPRWFRIPGVYRLQWLRTHYQLSRRDSEFAGRALYLRIERFSVLQGPAGVEVGSEISSMPEIGDYFQNYLDANKQATCEVTEVATKHGPYFKAVFKKVES